MCQVPLAAAVRARGLPGRILAMGVVAVVGAFAARVPAPSLRVDLEAASYPAVAVVTAAAVATLLTAGAVGSGWTPVDGVADHADWVASAILAVPAFAVVWHGSGTHAG